MPDAALSERWPTSDDALPHVVVLPGGAGGAKALAESATVGQLLKAQEGRGALIAAVCAAPTALVTHGIGTGRPATSHPGVSSAIASHFAAREERVVRSLEPGAAPLITSRGPGTSFEFALAIVEQLCGPEKAAAVAEPMVLAG